MASRPAGRPMVRAARIVSLLSSFAHFRISSQQSLLLIPLIQRQNRPPQDSLAEVSCKIWVSRWRLRRRRQTTPAGVTGHDTSAGQTLSFELWNSRRRKIRAERFESCWKSPTLLTFRSRGESLDRLALGRFVSLPPFAGFTIEL